MKRLLSGVLGVLMVAAVMAPSPAAAEFPSPAVYVGVYGGAYIRTNDWDIGHKENGLPTTRFNGDVGFRVGGHILPQLAIEAGFAYVPIKSATATNHAMSYDIQVLYHFLKSNWSPFVSAGFGGYTNFSADLGKDTDPRGLIGIGVRGLVTPWMALRLDIRDAITDGLTKGGAHIIEILLGLDFFVWGVEKPEPKPADRDGDGVPDEEDACPDEPGTIETKGCPDRDGDGIIDSEDECPDEKGPRATKGCPDRDGDGIPDKDDRCPDAAGLPALKGCPDSDGDGVPDIDDRCPDVAGPKSLKGCPDSDGDGVPDIDDKCPEIRGLKSHDGCLPEKAKKFTGAIKGIKFATGSAKIHASSNKVLDEAVKVLMEFTDLRLRIEGHTDSTGKYEKNKTLSQARAESVRDYLISKGVAADRLEAVGYGPDRPVADNRTSKGRAENRRTEFNVLAVEE
ncbi:OmpA family protein [Myxococcota bacterium]|mgnify:FL=1|jgi:OOP family OmpA-OmpF porin|nr:OmpA family protein [Myxococcota bacterium]HHW96469.1 OmpA family protein [Oligoflexales bacterium]